MVSDLSELQSYAGDGIASEYVGIGDLIHVDYHFGDTSYLPWDGGPCRQHRHELRYRRASLRFAPACVIVLI